MCAHSVRSCENTLEIHSTLNEKINHHNALLVLVLGLYRKTTRSVFSSANNIACCTQSTHKATTRFEFVIKLFATTNSRNVAWRSVHNVGRHYRGACLLYIVLEIVLAACIYTWLVGERLSCM